MHQPTVLLRAANICKSFAGVAALKNISFELRSGEIHALVGENGAGKSTFIKIATGVIAADSGVLEVSGKQIGANDPNYARTLGIAVIYQQPSLFPHLSVEENIALTLENGGRSWKVYWKARRAEAEQLIARLGAEIDPRRPASSLSPGEQQVVEIAKAIGSQAKIVLMDEPTSLLTNREVDNLFRLTRQLRDTGVGIVYVSHRLDEIQALADRITVFRDGETIATREARTVTREELIQMVVGRSITSIFPKREVVLGETALEVREFGRDAGLRSISLFVRSGEILGLAGLVGSGRTEFARTLFGLTPSNCEILLHGMPVKVSSPADAIRLGIAYLPEDRRQHGVILAMSIAANISMADMKTVARWGLVDREREDELALRYTHELGVKMPGIEAPVESLSGGNQQKVALARWLAVYPRILILDEPTQGVDVGAKAEIHSLIGQLAEKGVAILLISSELPEILGMCDRVAVFHNRAVAGVLPRTEANQSSIMALALGHTDVSLALTRKEQG